MSDSEDSSADCAAQIHLREATVLDGEKAKKFMKSIFFQGMIQEM
jgi:hypothetical protein